MSLRIVLVWTNVEKTGKVRIIIVDHTYKKLCASGFFSAFLKSFYGSKLVAAKKAFMNEKPQFRNSVSRRIISAMNNLTASKEIGIISIPK